MPKVGGNELGSYTLTMRDGVADTPSAVLQSDRAHVIPAFDTWRSLRHCGHQLGQFVTRAGQGFHAHLSAGEMKLYLRAFTQTVLLDERLKHRHHERIACFAQALKQPESCNVSPIEITPFQRSSRVCHSRSM